ncbi:MAG: nucleotidyltransferase domain-containing protein [Candidatus Thorarchaeota archaeon]
MMNIRAKFEQALQDTVDEWKKQEHVEGIFVYGSYVNKAQTPDSDLDVCIVWNEEEAPVRLLSHHKGVRIDMTFITPATIQEVLNRKSKNPQQIAEVIERVKGSKVAYDKSGKLEEWRATAENYTWPEDVVIAVKERTAAELDRSKELLDEHRVSSICELRNALFDLARTILMTNNNFGIIRTADVVSQSRLLNPTMYKMFLRTFKLRSMNEEQIMNVLDDVKSWLQEVEDRLEKSDLDTVVIPLLNRAHRHYFGALSLTINNSYELAVLEMRHSIFMIANALLAMHGIQEPDSLEFITSLREKENEFYEDMLLSYCEFNLQPRAISRAIDESKFVLGRLAVG